jgi:hypothetical protein
VKRCVFIRDTGGEKAFFGLVCRAAGNPQHFANFDQLNIAHIARRRSSGSCTLRSPSGKDSHRMNRKDALAMSLAIVLWSVCSATASAEDMKVTRQIILSPAHKVAPYLIVQASNGDLIVAGAAGLGNNRAWATRVSKSGEPVWEYVDGPAGGWTDYSDNHQRFYGIVDLANGNTLLCGIKKIDDKISAFLVRLAPDGRLIDERILQPGSEGFPTGGIQCLSTQDGVAMVSWLAVLPRGMGWLLKLDTAGNVLWEKFGDQFGNLDAMPGDNGGLFMIGGQDVIKIDREGNQLSRVRLPPGSDKFIHSAGARAKVRIGASLSPVETEIFEFDVNLHGPLHTTHLDNIGINRGLDSGNGVATLFGSRYFHGPTAGAARVYPNGDSKVFTVEPRFQSGWFYDAVPTDSSGREFATVRSLNADGTGALAWISFK